MTQIVKQNSTVLVDYTGRLEDKQIFDTSKEDIAKENDLYNDQRDYGPLEVKMGENTVIPGFEKALQGMKTGEKKTVTIPPEEAYGDISADHIVAVPDEQFKENNIPLAEGTVIQTSQGIATIKEHDENSNEVTLDFNHPLAGRTLEFELEIIEIQ